MGALFQYGLWGGDSSNDVPTSARTGPRGSFNEIPECPEWIGALNDGDYDYVITTPDLPPGRPGRRHRSRCSATGSPGAGNVQHVAGADLVDVWKVTGPLDPLACAAAPRHPRGAAAPPATK